MIFPDNLSATGLSVTTDGIKNGNLQEILLGATIASGAVDNDSPSPLESPKSSSRKSDSPKYERKLSPVEIARRKAKIKKIEHDDKIFNNLLEMTKQSSYVSIHKLAKDLPENLNTSLTLGEESKLFINILSNTSLSSEQKCTLIVYLINSKELGNLFCYSVFNNKLCLNELLSDNAYDVMFNSILDFVILNKIYYTLNEMVWKQMVENQKYDYIYRILKAYLNNEEGSIYSFYRYNIYWINKLCETETEVMNAFQYIENAINEHLNIKKYGDKIEEITKDLTKCKSELFKLSKQKILSLELEKPDTELCKPEIPTFLQTPRHNFFWFNLFKPKTTSLKIHNNIITHHKEKAAKQWRNENIEVEKSLGFYK